MSLWLVVLPLVFLAIVIYDLWWTRRWRAQLTRTLLTKEAPDVFQEHASRIAEPRIDTSADDHRPGPAGGGNPSARR